MTQETVDALRAVPARQAVEAEGDLEDGKPFVVGTLRNISLKVVGLDMLPLACDACPREQVAVFGDETRSAASAQKDEKMQQKQWFYEPSDEIHAAKIQKSWKLEVES